MEKNLYRRGLSLLLAAGVLLSCAACGAKTAAATMHLRKTEGAVGVSDGEKAIEPKENLGLYSGYGVDTQAESYAWIDLDEVKLTKLDQNSEIEITKEDKHLTIEVKSGGLFFNVTQPLAEDEIMDIRTSTMAIGIRGTCGWVRENAAALLEGEVEVTAGDQSATITAGEMAYLTEDGGLEVKSFYQENIPAFVLGENLEENILAEVPSLYPLTVLTRQTVQTKSSLQDDALDITGIVDYFYDEEGYVLRRESRSCHSGEGSSGEWSDTDAEIFSYDGEGHLLLTSSDGDTREIPYVPGTVVPIGSWNYAFTDPIVTTYHYDGRLEIGPDGRLELGEYSPYGMSDSYAIYTMDANGYPINIDTYASDGTLTGQCTLEWAVIERT